jgi:hypothetical protein
MKINDFIYTQCVTYIVSEKGKTLDHDVWTGGNPPRTAAVPLVGPGKGDAPPYVGCAVHMQKTVVGLNLIQYNTYNKPSRFGLSIYLHKSALLCLLTS